LICRINGRTQVEGVKNKELTRIFGTKRETLAEGWRKRCIHKYEIHSFYSALNTVRVIKSKKMRTAALRGKIQEEND
jgi:hypothetical protein